MPRQLLGSLPCLFIVICLFGAGCSGSDAPSLVPASGTVLVNDKPVADANVNFIVEGKPLAIGVTNSEGKFSITTGGRPGAPLGKAKVTISKTSSTGNASNPSMKPEDMMKMQKANNGATPGVVEEIPGKYGVPETSGLEADLDSDGAKNVFEFRLNK